VLPAVPPVPALPLPESRPAAEPVTDPTAPETTSVAPDPDPPEPDPEPDPEPEPPPGRSGRTVVCPAMVEIAEVTVPIGSSGPAIATLLAAPQNASRAKKSIRVAAGRM
jgi:hypothetical protein